MGPWTKILPVGKAALGVVRLLADRLAVAPVRLLAHGEHVLHRSRVAATVAMMTVMAQLMRAAVLTRTAMATSREQAVVQAAMIAMTAMPLFILARPRFATGWTITVMGRPT